MFTRGGSTVHKKVKINWKTLNLYIHLKLRSNEMFNHLAYLSYFKYTKKLKIICQTVLLGLLVQNYTFLREG